MKDQLITFETAIQAKEKGFDIRTERAYYGDSWTESTGGKSHGKEEAYAPTQSLLQKYFREKHELHAYADCNIKGWYWGLERTNGTSISCQPAKEPYHKTYELALERALVEANKTF